MTKKNLIRKWIRTHWFILLIVSIAVIAIYAMSIISHNYKLAVVGFYCFLIPFLYYRNDLAGYIENNLT